MSRVSTINAIAAYLQQPTQYSGAIPALSNVFMYPPKITQEQQWFNNLPSGIATGAVIYIALRRQNEERIALGGAHGGRKWRQYECFLACFLRYTGPTSEQACADADAFIDGLLEWIEADRTLGTGPAVGGETLPGMIFQAGEGGIHGGPDLETEVFMPSLVNDELTQLYFSVTMAVCEILDT
jgi:hypothetical protein